MRYFIVPALILLFASSAIKAAVPNGNAAYLFDFQYDAKGDKKGHQPGLFAAKINEYNRTADNPHHITQLFSYAGDMEMFCRGSANTRKSKACKPDDLMVFYGNGARSAQAYSETMDETDESIKIVPVVDGHLDSINLRGFNNMTEAEAVTYADKIAATFCRDTHVNGVQFDLEPFDLKQPGQLFFYKQIAKDFSNGNCVDEYHPKGRYFSVFTNSSHIDADVGKVLNQYHNGYVVDALYDLGPRPKGVATSPEEYKRLVHREIVNMNTKASQYHVKFLLAVPVAATGHEFESRSGKETGYQQMEYVKAAFAEINGEKIRDNANFMGVALWAFTDRMLLGSHEYLPAKPDKETENYLMKNL